MCLLVRLQHRSYTLASFVFTVEKPDATRGVFLASDFSVPIALGITGATVLGQRAVAEGVHSRVPFRADWTSAEAQN